MAYGRPWEARTLITVPSLFNEEINLVVYDAAFAGQLEKSFQEDLKYSKKLTYEAWNSRPFIDKILELFSIPIKEQL
jgi:cardiolipin synthase A/B